MTWSPHDVLLAHAYHQREEELGYRVHPSYDSLAPVDFEPTMQSRYIKESDLSHDVWETYSWGNCCVRVKRHFWR